MGSFFLESDFFIVVHLLGEAVASSFTIAATPSFYNFYDAANDNSLKVCFSTKACSLDTFCTETHVKASQTAFGRLMLDLGHVEFAYKKCV